MKITFYHRLCLFLNGYLLVYLTVDTGKPQLHSKIIKGIYPVLPIQILRTRQYDWNILFNRNLSVKFVESEGIFSSTLEGIYE